MNAAMKRLMETYAKMDERQQKVTIFCVVVALVIGFVVFPPLSVLRQMFGVVPRPQPRKPSAFVVPAHPPVAPLVRVTPPSPLQPQLAAAPDALLGIWQGEAALPSRGGVCHLKLELRKSDATQDHITGYLTMLCAHSVSGRRPTYADSAMAATGRLNPVSAILGGESNDGVLKLHVEKNLGVTLTGRGCAMTSFTATRFGNNQLATEWQDSVCGDGQIMLNKTQ